MIKSIPTLAAHMHSGEGEYRYGSPAPWRLLLAVPLSILLSACTASTAQMRAPATTQSKEELLDALATAKRRDWTYAIDPHVAPSEQEDFLDQMNKTDRAIKELTHGLEVPQSEIEDALVIPPKSLSPEQREQLIKKLHDAVQQDDRNEQAMLNDLAWSDSVAPADTCHFDQQKELANGIIKDLEIGEDVHWSIITNALVVPQSPY